MTIPCLGAYAATTSFVNYFSRMLSAESAMKNSNVKHQLIYPNYVATKMSGQRPSFFCATAEAYAQSVVDLIGLTEECCGHYSHELQYALMHCVPKWLISWLFLSHLKAEKLKDL